MKKHNIQTMAILLGMTGPALFADPIKLNDGTAFEGELAAPVTVTIKTASGDKLVPFDQLPPELQARYWSKPATAVEVAGPVQNEELAALAASVNLKTWSQVAAYGSFRDKPEKRGTGGLVVTKAFNAIEENWAGVYGEGHALLRARNWQDAITRARALLTRNTQYLQKRWIESFILAGEAVAKKDSAEFARQIRALKASPLSNEALMVAEM